MAIYTFSSKKRKPEEDELIAEVKKICERRHMSFSALVVNLLKEWLANEQRD